MTTIPMCRSLTKIEAMAKVVTTLSLGSSMDEDFVPSPSKDVVSTLVSSFSQVCCSLSLSFLLSEAGSAEDRALGVVSPAPS